MAWYLTTRENQAQEKLIVGLVPGGRLICVHVEGQKQTRCRAVST